MFIYGYGYALGTTVTGVGIQKAEKVRDDTDVFTVLPCKHFTDVPLKM